MLYKKKIVFILLLLSLFPLEIRSSGGASNWSYADKGGIKEWKSKFPTCNGRNQSPVDIITALTFRRDYGPIKIINYNTASSQILFTNTGTTVVGELHQDPKAKIIGGGLSAEYYAHSFHFHWGSADGYGSEHFKDGTSYPMELHIVHYSSKYSSIVEAREQPEGLAVLGFFFTISTVNNTVLQSIIEKLPLIKTVGSNTKVDGQLGLLIPTDREKFYRYSGSLTTPPCSETVVWTIFESTIPVSSPQMKEFRMRVFSKDSKSASTTNKMSNNYREIQPLFQREIFMNKADPIQHKALFVMLMIGVHFC